MAALETKKEKKRKEMVGTFLNAEDVEYSCLSVIGGSYATQGGGQIELPVKRRSYSSVERGLSACSTAFLAIYRSEYERSVYTASSGCTSVLIQLGAARDKTPHPIKSVINIHGNGSILLPFKKLSHPLSLK